ncbi:MAG TPA: CoA-transferase [Solirubrobacterales bacterium]|nr:CoA-transferase [Solirubrobacterales bacterium]
MSEATRAEVCVVACADAWRDAGEILISPFGAVPAVGARLARATFAPELLLSDGEAMIAAGVWPYGEKPPVIEGWIPFRAIFDLVFGGRRHVMMMPSQIDRYGNTNISSIGADYRRPDVQLLGSRGAPGNTVNHPTSYWLPRHSARAFVPRVDFVSGVGYDSAAAAGPAAERFHDLRRVVTNLAVLDFGGPERSMRLVSVHPGVTRAEVEAATGFELAGEAEPPESRAPSEEELRLIREVIDPRGARESEVPA